MDLFEISTHASARLIEYLKIYYSLCRFESWPSWIFSFFLGSFIFTLPSLHRFILMFSSFTCATAFIFIINQYYDSKYDKNNEYKRQLPIASDIITPRKSLMFSIILSILSLFIATYTDIKILPYLLIYIGLGIAYSAPIINLKTKPIIDFIVSGVGAGYLPFLIGLGTSKQLYLNNLFILSISVPLILYQSGGHIIQSVGDYHSDKREGLNTFSVRFGRKKAMVTAGILFISAGIYPFIYILFGFLQAHHIILCLILIPFIMPIIKRFMVLYFNPSDINVLYLKSTVNNVGLLILFIISAYILVFRFIYI